MANLTRHQLIQAIREITIRYENLSPEDKMDPELAIASVSHRSHTLSDAPPSIRDNEEVVLAAITPDPAVSDGPSKWSKKEKDALWWDYLGTRASGIEFCSERLKKDHAFLARACAINPRIASYIDIPQQDHHIFDPLPSWPI